MAKATASAIAGLLTGAVVWGMLWYPYRLLERHGISGATATLLTYVVAIAISILAFRGSLRPLLRPDPLLALIALAAGWTNLAYVLGMIGGEVMQVLLLFYLAPLWTVLFALLLLGERPGVVGLLVVLLALGGAGLMLWRPGMRMPLPASTAEWFGLSAGITFALSNVLIRKAHHQTIPVKSTAVFIGVVLVALVVVQAVPNATAGVPASAHELQLAGSVVAIGVILFGTNLAVQHGITRVAATQAIVILLSELIVAAISAYLLAGEVMVWNQWLGGSLIVAASLLSGRLEQKPA